MYRNVATVDQYCPVYFYFSKTVDLRHSQHYKGKWLRCEVMAMLIALVVVFYYTHTHTHTHTHIFQSLGCLYVLNIYIFDCQLYINKAGEI